MQLGLIDDDATCLLQLLLELGRTYPFAVHIEQHALRFSGMAFLGRRDCQALLFQLMGEALLRSSESFLELPALRHAGLNLALQGNDFTLGPGKIGVGFGQALLQRLQWAICADSKLTQVSYL